MANPHATPLAEQDAAVAESPSDLLDRYQRVRDATDAIREPLTPEDCVVQSMPDVSPTRWHLAHTTWFFETFVLREAGPHHEPIDPAFEYLFNSYYNTVGEQFPRHRRGLLSRPTVAEVLDYRAAVDERMSELLESLDPDSPQGRRHAEVTEIGLHHEQQHQELMLTDILHVLSCNPLRPTYRDANAPRGGAVPALGWVGFDEGVRALGHPGGSFGFDNEFPRHRVFVEPFALADRLVTNGEYLEFVRAGGYRDPQWWLSAGWAMVQAEGWQAPLHWYRPEGASQPDDWHEFSLSGPAELDPSAPVCHISYFEADAYARWTGFRLPTEAEWETAAADLPIRGNLQETGHLKAVPIGLSPGSNGASGGLHQLFGDVWEWTASQYLPYPRYRAPAGALGEYNGKFMCNQFVLRGGSCATPTSHLRATYRNFFPPDARWQFSGIRLARDVE